MNKNTGSKQTIDRVLARQVAERTYEAYSRSRYSDAGWLGIARRLATEGLNALEIEWVLTSKHMRWAADFAGRNHSATAADFAAYVEKNVGFEKLAREARNNAKHDIKVDEALSGANLAGACEGEQIADLIELARQVANGQASNPVGAKRLQAKALALITEIEGRAK